MDADKGNMKSVKASQAKSLVFAEEFDAISWGSRWSGSRSSAYEDGLRNPKDGKLDELSSSSVTAANGVATFTAKPSGGTTLSGWSPWTTGLLTTEGTAENFQVIPGDIIEARVRLPESRGAWPALWTWKDGGNEVDIFEYHPDNPDMLELSNGVKPSGVDHRDPNVVSPGKWITVGVHFESHSNNWFLNGKNVYSDSRGVGAEWSAHLILNLSVSAGKWHPAPDDANPISFLVDYVRVWR
ncbi:glycoside hydrolase family 16 protein [Streptomyces virginiae]|uniref:glycoside hydrolase family 16 protein n=1 Tax=Streptomyces virginiae TaxID=1961 RepID=UPI0033334CDE